MTIQCHLLALDAPCLAVIAGAAPITPSTNRALIHDAPLSRFTSATDNDGDDDDLSDGLIQAHLGVDANLHVHSLRPSGPYSARSHSD